jgi:RimJ/RimL family protein N-acetyltransferase
VNEIIAHPWPVPAYDREEEPLTLADGSIVCVRPARLTDGRALQRFYDGLSTHSRYQRFFGFLKVLTEERARTFTQLDRADSLALIALDPVTPERIVAVVSYGREAGADRADIAAAVADDWQERGLGLALMRLLVMAARRRGVPQFSAVLLPQNERIYRVLDALGLPMRGRWEDGFVRFDLDLSTTAQGVASGHTNVAAD